MDRNLALELVRVTEAAALASARLMGRGDRNGADQAAVEAMRRAFNDLSVRGEVVIGEGANLGITQRGRIEAGAVEAPAVGVLEGGPGLLPRRGDLHRLPAECALLSQERGGSKGVAAMQRNGVVQYVKRANHAVSPASMTLRRKASNMRIVQIEAL